MDVFGRRLRRRYLRRATMVLVSAAWAGVVIGVTTHLYSTSDQPPLVLALSATASSASSPLRLDAAIAERVQHHAQALAGEIGVRVAGTPAEAQAARYVEGQFKACGYTVAVQRFPLPNGRASQNVIARRSSPESGVRSSGLNPPSAVRHPPSQPLVVLGAHLDTKPTTPGASDNASGVALLLELARTLKDTKLFYDLTFVAFGAEEYINHKPHLHHQGSRYFVQQLKSQVPNPKSQIPNPKSQIPNPNPQPPTPNPQPPTPKSEPIIHQPAMMLSLDMIGVGTQLRVSTLGTAHD